MTDQVVNTSSANKYESTGSAASTPEPCQLVLLSCRLWISKTYLQQQCRLLLQSCLSSLLDQQSSRWKSSFLILALIVMTGLSFMYSSKSSADMKYKYYLNFLYQDMRFNLRVNDVSLLKELDPKGFSISVPVGNLLKKGWNTIELDYAAYGKKSGKREYTDKFRFKIILNEIGYEGGVTTSTSSKVNMIMKPKQYTVKIYKALKITPIRS